MLFFSCTFLAIFSSCRLSVLANVQVEIGEKTRTIISSNINETFLHNSFLVVQLKCIAFYPTQWVYNADTPEDNSVFRKEWTERQVATKYIAWIELSMSTLTTKYKLTCQAVNNSMDTVVIQVLPDRGSVKICTLVTPSLPEPADSANLCKINLFLMYVNGFGYFGQCAKNLMVEIGTTVNHPCLSSASECANTFRKLKGMSHICLKVIPSQVDLLRGNGWKRLSSEQRSIPGIVTCIVGNSLLGAIEYFFTAPHNVTGKREIHNFWKQANANETIWVTPSYFLETYYTGQSISGKCVVPYYGFSYYPKFVLKINNSVQIEEQSYIANDTDSTWVKVFNIKLNRTGFFEIQCLGPIWDSTEWATKSVKFEVKDQIPPYFDKADENVTLIKGNDGQRISCKANGNPTPQIEWGVESKFHGIKVNRDELIFLSVTDFTEGEYSCTATNTFGQSANKTITVNVSKNTFQSSEYSTNPPVLGIAVAIGIVTVVASGIGYSYLKFKRLNKIILGVLSSDEYYEFRRGKVLEDGDYAEPGTDFIASLPYNNAYELPRHTFDLGPVIGFGSSATVYKGTVTTRDGCVDAAFKTIKEGVNRAYLKALLTEVKILIHLGKHDSIVNLIGACTDNIREGEVIVVVELCDCTLQTFLRNKAGVFLNFVRNGAIMTEPESRENPPSYSNCRNDEEDEPKFSTFNLIQWATEIATGLEYISTKSIVHGDIAARNILLTFDRKAKICDFGLAKELFIYSEYIMETQVPLPWKWMAIESLNQRIYSTKSDVWAFGITLWEMFTMGETPFPGLTWSDNFVSQLEQGLRLPQPAKVPKEIWDVMSDCWREDPTQRPTFTDVKNSLKNFQI